MLYIKYLISIVTLFIHLFVFIPVCDFIVCIDIDVSKNNYSTLMPKFLSLSLSLSLSPPLSLSPSLASSLSLSLSLAHPLSLSLCV